MNLVIDIGNTIAKIAVFRDGSIVVRFSSGGGIKLLLF